MPVERLAALPAPFDRKILEADLRALKQPAWGQKPKGFWWACGEAWIRWVEREMPEHLGDYEWVYRVELDERKILRIDTRSKAVDLGNAAPGAFKEAAAVARVASGIELCPVPMANWSYGWDVPSGCLWNASALIDVELVAAPPSPRRKAPHRGPR